MSVRSIRRLGDQEKAEQLKGTPTERAGFEAAAEAEGSLMVTKIGNSYREVK